MSTINTLLGAGAIAIAMATAGCVVAVGNSSYPSGPDSDRWYVESDQMRTLVDDNKRLELGMTKAEALGLYPGDLTTLMSSARVEDTTVEEWRVQAYEGTRKRVKTSFRRWLYFADGELVRFSEDRIDYVGSPDALNLGG